MPSWSPVDQAVAENLSRGRDQLGQYRVGDLTGAIRPGNLRSAGKRYVFECCYGLLGVPCENTYLAVTTFFTAPIRPNAAV